MGQQLVVKHLPNRHETTHLPALCDVRGVANGLQDWEVSLPAAKRKTAELAVWENTETF